MSVKISAANRTTAPRIPQVGIHPLECPKRAKAVDEIVRRLDSGAPSDPWAGINAYVEASKTRRKAEEERRQERERERESRSDA